MKTKKLFLIFTITSILELSLLIYLGKFIGFWYTILIVIITAMIGSILIKKAGASVMMKVQQAIFQQKGITDAILDGGILIFSGALLITPGFLSDIVGISIHLPIINEFVKNILKKKFGSYFKTKTGFTNNSSSNDNTIDLDDFYM